MLGGEGAIMKNCLLPLIFCLILHPVDQIIHRLLHVNVDLVIALVYVVAIAGGSLTIPFKHYWLTNVGMHLNGQGNVGPLPGQQCEPGGRHLPYGRMH